MKYFYIDGDDIGLRLERSLLQNDEIGLREVNAEVNSAIRQLTDHLEELGCEIIFSGADGIIAKSSDLPIDRINWSIRQIGGTLEFSVGIGDSLRDAFAALRFAKASGKNGIAILDTKFHWKSNGVSIKEDRTIAYTEGGESSSGWAMDNLSHILGDS